MGRPATFHAASARNHIIAIRSTGVVTSERSSGGSSPSRKPAIGHVALAARLRSLASRGSIAIDSILAQIAQRPAVAFAAR